MLDLAVAGLIALAAESVFHSFEAYSRDAWQAELTGEQNKKLEEMKQEFALRMGVLQNESEILAAAERFRRELRLAEL